MSIWEKMGFKSDLNFYAKTAIIISILVFPPLLIPFITKRRMSLQETIIALYIILFWIFILLRMGCDAVLDYAYAEQLPISGFWHFVDRVTSPPFQLLGDRVSGYILVFAVFFVGGVILITLLKRQPERR